MKPGVYTREDIVALAREGAYCVGRFEFHPMTREVWLQGADPLALSDAQSYLLKSLLDAYPGWAKGATDGATKALMRRLNKGLGIRIVVSARGRGYRFNPMAVL